VPFAFEQALLRHLDKTPDQASGGEVEAAARWLRRLQGAATYKALSAICGESRAAIYSHMNHLLRPATPSRYAIEAVRKGTRELGAIDRTTPRPVL
jgi:hypothetical protein